MSSSSCLLLLLFCFLPTTTAATAEDEMFNNGSSCIAAEREALLSFKAGITSDPCGWLRSWQGQDCCRWYGVRCSARTGHVLGLDLDNDFFDDDIAIENNTARWLQGQISPSLVSLRHVKRLNLSGNALGGNMPIPKFMGALKSLTHLDLSNIDFSGRLPPQLGNLTRLEYLDIHGNTYAYTYTYTYTYSPDVSWLSKLHSLEYLDMSFVNLSTVVDSVNTLPNLKVLHLTICQLNSSVPSLLHHNLTLLEELYLDGNSFKSPAAPNWYWAVTSLRSLDLGFCELSSPFPDQLGNFTKLVDLGMRSNNMEGMIPSTLKNMCDLESIWLDQSNIGGDITDLIERLPNCSWDNLQVLRLSDTNITGTLKSIHNLTALGFLKINDNHLSGSVPVEIGTLKNLVSLDIGNNKLRGVMKESHFSGLTNLVYIGLSHNYLRVMVDLDWEPPFNLKFAHFSSCHLGGQVPNWLRRQPNIEYLEMSDASLGGRIPEWFWVNFANAYHLNLSYNKLSGQLPRNLGFMSVTELFLQSNHFTGYVPQLPKSLVLLDISRNFLKGTLPSNFGAPNLQVAVLYSNCISGAIPGSICRLPQLRALDLSNNLLTRGLPDCGKVEIKQQNPSSNNSSRVNSASSYSCEIRILLLSNNNLSGEFPLFLKQCQNLVFLDLTQNTFSGDLPAWISEHMTRLIMLRLRSNNYSGHIPIEIMRLSSLHILDLANNTFSGVIPQSLVKLEALTTTAMVLDILDDPFLEVHLYGFQMAYINPSSNDSLSLVIKGQVLEYGDNVEFFMSIDLSCNMLTGQIPEDIGSLLGLINLNLSSNLLSGNIPHKIGNLQSLESLDLSDNKLSGEIPWCLSNLTSLSYLNLSYNNLSGRIPSGRQLDTLMTTDDPASMYIGNPGLCGHPLPKVCPGDQPSQEDPIRWHKDSETQMDFHLGLTLGFLVGLWIVFCGLLFKKTWRYAYFSLFDKLYDKMLIFLVTWQKRFKKPRYEWSKVLYTGRHIGK